MTATERRRAKADEYRQRAAASGEAAAAAALETVRDTHLRAELRWTQLAAVEDRRLEELKAVAVRR